MRETTSGVPEALSQMGNVVLEFKDLPTGDYILAESVVVERKTAADFVASIIDHRLFSQVANMRANYEQPLLLIEGDILHPRSDIAPTALIGALSYVAALAGIPILPSKNASYTASILATVARHCQHGLGYEIPLRCHKPKDTSTVLQYLVEGLPGVGAGRAITLLKHFGSPIKLFNAEIKDLMEVDGIGKQAAQKIYDVIHAQYTPLKRN